VNNHEKSKNIKQRTNLKESKDFSTGGFVATGGVVRIPEGSEEYYQQQCKQRLSF
jgi:hypothetical protein